MMHRAVLGIAALSASLLHSNGLGAESSGPIGSKREPVTTFSKNWQVPITAFEGRGVRVWQDSSTRYVIEPYLIPDWAKFDSDLAAKCAAKSDTDRATVRLSVEMDSPSVVSEVTAYLRKLRQDVDASEIGGYPFLMLTFYTGGSDANDELPRTVRHRLPLGVESSTSTDNLSINYALLDTQQVPLTDTCGVLRSIRETSDLQASMFAPYDEVKSNTMRVVLKNFRSQEAVRDLMESQTLEGQKKLLWSSKSKKTGFNLGPLSTGSTGTSGSTTPLDTRRRIVSSSLLSDVVEEASRSIEGRYVVRLKSAKIDAKTIYDTLWGLVEKRSAADTLYFEKQADDRWKVYTQHESWLLDQPAVQELIQAKVDSDATTNREVEGSYGEAKGKEKHESTFKVVTDVQWKTEGTTPIPVSAKIRYVDGATFNYEDVASWEEAEVTEGQGLQTITITSMDRQSNAYTSGFRDGFKRANLERRAPERVVIPTPYSMFPNFAKPLPFVPMMRCEKPKEASEAAGKLLESYKHLTGAFKNEPAFMKAYADAFTDFASKIGCMQVTSLPLNAPLPGPDESVIWHYGCFINMRFSTWYMRRLIEIGGVPQSAAACFNAIPDIPVFEPPASLIRPIAPEETVNIQVVNPWDFAPRASPTR
jgi:hypothetical protein